MKRHIFIRALSFFLSILIVVSLLPAEAFAQERAFGIPIYKDHVFYDALTGEVTGLEETSMLVGSTYVIQESVNGRQVTALADDLLWGMDNITVQIPDSVTTIPDLSEEQNVTFICSDNSAAANYAQTNGIQRITAEENQLRIDSKKLSDKTITVFYNERGLHGVVVTPAEENCYLAAKKATVILSEPVSGVDRKIPLDKSGSAKIEKASDAATLQISMDKYETITVNYKDLKEKDNKFYLEPAGDIRINSLKVEYEEETEKSCQISYADVYHDEFVIDRYSEQETHMIVDVNWGSHGAGTVALEQTGSSLQFTDGELRYVLQNKFDTTEDIYIVATAGDKTTLKRKLNIKSTDGFWDGAELDLTGGLKVTLPSGFPFVGGKGVDLDLGKFPLEFAIENGKIYGIVGFKLTDYSYKDKQLGNGKPGRPAKVKSFYFDIKNGFKKNKKGVSDIDKQIENLQKLFTNKNFSRYIRRTHSELSLTGDVQVMGYIEGTLRPNGTPVWSDAEIILAASGKVQFSGQYTLGPAPMYWKIYLKGDSEGHLNVARAIPLFKQNVPFRPLGSVRLEGAVGGSTGLGVGGLLSVGGGVEGSTQADFLFKTDVGNLKWGGKFSVFIEAEALFWSWNKKWDVLQGTWVNTNFYGGNSKAVSLYDEESTNETDLSGLYDPSHYQLLDLSYLAEEGAFSANDASLFDSSGLTPFQGNTYLYPEAQMVRLDNGTQLMIWLGGAPDREGSNLTAVYYSWCPENGSWSSPAVLSDDKTSDFHPILAASGNTAWVAWQNADKVFTSEELQDNETAMPMVASHMEICAAKFTGTGFEATKTVTTNTVYDHSPALAVGGDSAVVYWLQSSENDFFGADTTTCVMYADLNTGSAASTVYQASHPIKSLAAGWNSSGSRYAVALDMDDDLNTSADMELVADGQQITANSSVDSSPTFSNGVLYWYQEGTVVSESNTKMLPDDVVLDTDQFQIYTNETGSTALVYAANNGVYAETNAVFQDNGVVSQPMALTDTKSHAIPGIGYYSGNELSLPCAVTAVNDVAEGSLEGTENVANPFGTTDLNLLSYTRSSALSIEDVSFDSSRLVEGNNFTVYATVKNTGTLPAEGFDVVLWDTPGKMPADEDGNRNPKVSDYRAVQPLAGGETAEVELSFTLPQDFAGTYDLTVSPGSSEDYDDNKIKNSAADTKQVTFSDWDLIVSAEMVEDADGNQVVKGTLANTGAKNLSNLEVALYAVGGEQDEKIETQTVTVDANSQAIVTFTLSSPETMLYRIEVPEQTGEVSIGNNSDICVVSSEEPFALRKCNITSTSAEVEVRAIAPDSTEDVLLMVAAYDSDGRMLSMKQENVTASQIAYSLSLNGSSITQVKCFLVKAATGEPVYSSLVYSRN